MSTPYSIGSSRRNITAGAWQATPVTAAYGGTGATTHTSGNVLLGAGTSAVTSAKAAPTGDFVGTTDSQTLTSKTLVSPTFSGTVPSNINLTTGSEFQINGTAIGGGGGGSGVNLETIQEVLRGQSITTVNGDTITLPNITAVVQPEQTGSHSILATITNYIPPSGTKSVMLTLKFFIGWSGTGGSCDALFDCRVNSEYYSGGVITSQSFIKTSGSGMGEIGEYCINCLMNVDSSIAADDLPNGKIKIWTSGYTFNFASSRTMELAANGPTLFSNNPHPYNTATSHFIPPIIMIKAFS